MDIFLLTGEPSGDLHGAHLARALRALAPAAVIRGAGGPRMAEAGVELVARSEHWGAMGIAEALKRVPRLLVEMARLQRGLRRQPPDALVAIDFGAFNMTLLRRLRHDGLRTVYYIPPGCWSRTRPVGDLPSLVSAVATPFPWSADRLRDAGVRAEWVGHPILDYCRITLSRAEARARLGLADDRPLLAIVPGSRRQEIRHLLPVFLETARRLTPAPRVLLSVAPGAVLPPPPADLEVITMTGLDYDLLQAADAALAASGTATLELACAGVPLVAAYRGSRVDYLQYLLLIKRRLKYFSLPNILADAPVVPELLQYDASPDGLAAAVAPLLADTPARRAQCDAFARIRTDLGDGHAVDRAARLVLEVAEGR
jgi:lipid-A-disaccharide synthase